VLWIQTLRMIHTVLLTGTMFWVGLSRYTNISERINTRKYIPKTVINYSRLYRCISCLQYNTVFKAYTPCRHEENLLKVKRMSNFNERRYNNSGIFYFILVQPIIIFELTVVFFINYNYYISCSKDKSVTFFF